MTTQYANASYQEIIDLHTESDSVSVIGIHTPISDTPHKMMKGFFEQFKKFKYAGCSVSLVPAARLPADPLQVSYEAGETTIDPRDMLNPLMFHGCHGNDLGMVLNRLYNLNSGNSLASDSVNLHQGEVIQSDFVESDLILDGQELENLYYKALTDNTWKKAHPQRGFRKSGLHPMIYSLATTQQIMNESLIAAPTSPYNIGLTRGVPAPAEFDYDTVSNPAEWSVDVPINRQFKLMTPRIQKLGWLDTKQVLTNAGTAEGTFSTTGMSESEVREALSEAFTGALNGIVESQEVYATLPKIYMGVILMPPAYKTEQYFRMIITHHFEFKNFRGISFANDIHESPCYDNWNEDISLGSGGDTGGEVDPPNPDEPDDPGEGGGDVDPPVDTTSVRLYSDVNYPVPTGFLKGYGGIVQNGVSAAAKLTCTVTAPWGSDSTAVPFMVGMVNSSTRTATGRVGLCVRLTYSEEINEDETETRYAYFVRSTSGNSWTLYANTGSDTSLYISTANTKSTFFNNLSDDLWTAITTGADLDQIYGLS